MTETYIIEIYINTNCYVHTLPSKHLLVFKTSWRLQDMSWRRLQPLRRIEDVFKTSRKTSSRRLGRRKIVTLKTCLRHALKTSWKHVLKTSSRHILKTSSRRLGGKQNFYWWYLYLKNLNVYLTNLCFTNYVSEI